MECVCLLAVIGRSCHGRKIDDSPLTGTLPPTFSVSKRVNKRCTFTANSLSHALTQWSFHHLFLHEFVIRRSIETKNQVAFPPSHDRLSTVAAVCH
jgi:hypothetical protein